MGNEIRIRRSPTADTRTADHEVTKSELAKSSLMHIHDVRQAMDWMADKIAEAGDRHDWTKIQFLDDFYRQFHRAQETGEWGKGWYDETHTRLERHHLNDRCPDDVDLVDVIEMLCDGVMAGLARSGRYRDERVDPEMLARAYENTVRKLVRATVVEE